MIFGGKSRWGGIRRRRFPILAVYLLVLLGSPLGEAGSLMVHLATAHHEVGTSLGYRGADAAPTPFSIHGAHEHDGVVHTHEGEAPDDGAVKSPLSRFFLSPRSLLEPSPLLVAVSDFAQPGAPRQSVPAVDTPPPRPNV